MPMFSSGGPAAVHRLIQWGFLLFMVAVGLQFLLFALWALGASDTFVSRPPSVEAFLPISALLAFKRLLFTGVYDAIHPAGLTIMLMAFVTALVARKGFCGYLCPVGTLSFLLFRLGRRLGLTVSPPPWLAFLLTLPKYFLLLFFVDILLLNMGIDDIEVFLRSRYNMVADTKMLLFFLPPDRLTAGILLFLLGGSLFIPSFWCRCFCPYGALLGLLSICSPLAVTRNHESCTQCGKCSGACPAGIAVQNRRRVSGPECTGCMECVNACPHRDCLSLRAGYAAARGTCLPWWSVAALTLFAVAALYLWAVTSGHWETSLPREMWRALHENIHALRH